MTKQQIIEKILNRTDYRCTHPELLKKELEIQYNKYYDWVYSLLFKELTYEFLINYQSFMHYSSLTKNKYNLEKKDIWQKYWNNELEYRAKWELIEFRINSLLNNAEYK